MASQNEVHGAACLFCGLCINELRNYVCPLSRYDAIELRVRVGEWDVNSDTEFYTHVESDVNGVFVNPDFYSGNLINDIAVVRMTVPVDFVKK